MKTLVVRPNGAKNPASISPEARSPLFLLAPKAPEFEPPDASSPPPDAIFIWPEPSDSPVPPLVRKASRRALYAHRGRLRSCQHDLILFVAVNRNCLEVGHACLAEGGLSQAEIALPTLIAKAHTMEAAGLILLQNRPGPLDEETPIDPHPTMTIAIVCELLGIPLLEHIYIDGVGDPFFVAERGILTDVPDLVVTLRKWTKGMAEKELLRGICAPNYYDEQKAVNASPAPRSPVEIATRRPR
jgi:RadC-like JAB domain